jgi:hypothetical protein
VEIRKKKLTLFPVQAALCLCNRKRGLLRRPLFHSGAKYQELVVRTDELKTGLVFGCSPYCLCVRSWEDSVALLVHLTKGALRPNHWLELIALKRSFRASSKTEIRPTHRDHPSNQFAVLLSWNFAAGCANAGKDRIAETASIRWQKRPPVERRRAYVFRVADELDLAASIAIFLRRFLGNDSALACFARGPRALPIVETT